MQRLEQYASLTAQVWLPRWLYAWLPWACLLAGVVGVYQDEYFWASALILYGVAVLTVRYLFWAAWVSGMAVLLLAVPTVTPIRRIVVTTRPVVVDMVIVTEQRGTGPVKTTATPTSPRKSK